MGHESFHLLLDMLLKYELALAFTYCSHILMFC